jgi:hypothetical protein
MPRNKLSEAVIEHLLATAKAALSASNEAGHMTPRIDFVGTRLAGPAVVCEVPGPRGWCLRKCCSTRKRGACSLS